uniref:Uncharacterized protein n=1 Tax=Strongyloides papillosus TaxID=174720 RepID=A0A0N5C9K6_STREA
MLNIKNSKFPNVSTQFKVNINGNVNYTSGTGFNIELTKLKEIVEKKVPYYRIGTMYVLRAVTLCESMSCSENHEKAKVKKGNIEVEMDFEDYDSIINIENKIKRKNKDSGLLLFIEFKVDRAVIEGYIIREILVIDDLSTYEELFRLEMEVMEKAWDHKLFSTKKIDLIPNENGFNQVEFRILEGEEQKTSQSKATNKTSNSFHRDSLLSSRRTQSDPTNTYSNKRKGSEILHSTSFKKEKKEEPGLDVSLTYSNTNDKENLGDFEFPQSTIVSAIEATINSSGGSSVDISTIREFLGIKHSELASHLLKLTGQYDIFDGMKKIKRRN